MKVKKDILENSRTGFQLGIFSVVIMAALVAFIILKYM